MRRFLFLVSGLAVFFLDQLTKEWCLRHLTENVSVPWLDHWVYLTLTTNPRGAFSLFPFPNRLFIGLILGLLTFFLVYVLRWQRSWKTQIWVGLVVGGGAGNLMDRIHYGAVIDFIDLRFWPVFNVADSAVSVAMICLVLFWLFQLARLKKG